MLAATLLLPVSMVAIAMLTVAANDRGQDIGGGMYYRTDANGFPDVGEQKYRDAGIGLAALFNGFCCTLIPYVLLMLVLGTAYLAFRSAGT